MKYTVLKDYSAGFIANSNPPKPNIVVKAGETISGDLTTQFIGNANRTGISVQKSNGTVFVLKEDLKPFQSERGTPGSTKKEADLNTNDAVVFTPSATPIILELLPMISFVVGGGVGYHKEGDVSGVIKYGLAFGLAGAIPLGIYFIRRNRTQVANGSK